MTFPRTKIQPPRPRASHLARPALEARLAAAMAGRRVVLLCAPAGYGKTSLLVRAVARLGETHALAWISADAGDTLQSFLECLLAALEPFDPPWRTSPEALVQRVGSGVDAERAVAAELINALDAIEVAHGVIVIDDAHRIEDPAFARFAERLLERLGARWTMVLSSRTEPVLGLPRLRAAEDLAEFRQLQLQLTRDEARALARSAGLADRVFDRTQGWPAGVRIALGAAQADSATVERALRTSERPMFDYLTSEVLDQLRPELAQFLLRVSVLPLLEAGRCADVSGRADAAVLLDEIERLGLFVEVLDAPARTLRLHDLFREALEQRLRTQDPAAHAEARRRAAAAEPDPVRRMAMLADLGESAEAARLALEHLPSMIVTSGPAAVQHGLARFPAAFRETAPEIQLLRGLIGWVSWDFGAMREHFTRAEAGFRAARDEAHAQLAAAYRAHVLVALGRIDEAAGVLAAIQASPIDPDVRIVMLNAQVWLAIERGETRLVAPTLARMLELLEHERRPSLWYHTSPALRIPGLPGVHRPLQRHAQMLLRIGGEDSTPLRALGLLSEAWCELWSGNVARSRELRERAESEASWTGTTGAVRNHVLTLRPSPRRSRATARRRSEPRSHA